MNDPVTGPFSREEFAALVQAPFGQAIKEIRKHDPLYGRTAGEEIEWKVRCSGRMHGTAYVKAASEKDAEDLAAGLSASDIDWGDYNDDFDVIDVEPVSR